MTTKTSLVILNKNDVDGLRVIYPQIPTELLHEILVIDGQSTDDSVQFCEENSIKVVVQDKPGRGEAFRMALSFVSGDYVIFLSSDGNEEPKDIPKFIKLLDEGYDMIIASRLAKGARNKDDNTFFPLRKWMLQVFTKVVNVRWHSHITDIWNGYRAFRTDKLRSLPMTAENHSIELEQTIQAIKMSYRIAEFPTIEGDRIEGETRNPLIKTGWGLIRVLAREMLCFNIAGHKTSIPQNKRP